MICTMMLAGTSGCAHRAAARVEKAPQDSMAGKRRADALRRFDRAVLLKPKPAHTDSLELDLAPLIVVETPGDFMRDPANPFGAVYRNAAGRYAVDTATAVVYVMTDSVSGATGGLDVVSYVGFVPPAAPARTVADLPALVLRIVLDRDGYPVYWVVSRLDQVSVADTSRPGLLFVSEELEKESCEQFGEPLPGRVFCVEPDPAVAPDVFVTRTIPAGPIPMGPYVYLDGATHAPTTVLCRCSPSQVDQFAETVEYELRFANELPGDSAEGSASLDGTVSDPLGHIRGLEPWIGLRLPPGRAGR